MIFKLISLVTVVMMSGEVSSFGIGSTLYCYSCVSTQPGCSPFNWFLYWSVACPEDGDSCVKLIEKRGATEVITRDCLSSFKGIRTDIPADHYEGCRKATRDFRLANYVNNSNKEIDVKRDFYSDTTWCFCSFDNRCNSADSLTIQHILLASSLLFVGFFFQNNHH